MVKNPPANAGDARDVGSIPGSRTYISCISCIGRRCKRCRFDTWVTKIPWSRKGKLAAVLLPGNFHGQRSLAGYSPWGLKESDMTEQLTLSLSKLLLFFFISIFFWLYWVLVVALFAA